MRTLKPQVAKVSTVRVEKTFALPNWLVVIERAQLSYFSATFQLIAFYWKRVRFENESFIYHASLGRLCCLWFQRSHV